MREQSEPWCRGPGVKGRAAASRRPGARLKRPKHHDDTHWHSTENESSHRMTHSVLTHSTHSTTQRRLTHTHTRTRKHVTFKFYHCYLTPQHCQSATNCDSHRITQCVALRRRHHASIVPRPEKEQGVRSSPGEAKDCERGRGDREGGRERGMTTGCVGEWTAHQAIGKVAPLAILSLPPQTQQSPDQLKMS